MRKMIGLALMAAATVTGTVSIAGLLGLLPSGVQTAVAAAATSATAAAARLPQLTWGMDPAWAWASGAFLVTAVVARLIFYFVPRP